MKKIGIICCLGLAILLVTSGCSTGQSANRSLHEQRVKSTTQVSEGTNLVETSFHDKKKNQPTLLSNSIVSPPQGYNLAAQNNALALFINEQTTEIAVEDKASGKLFYSNPQNRDSDTVASGYTKGMLGGQISLTYIDSGSNLHDYDNYNFSINKKQFKIKNIKNGIEITYTIGDTSKGINDLPKFISKGRMQKLIFDKVDKESQMFILQHYLPEDKNPNIYQRFDSSLSTFNLNKVLSIFSKAGYTAKDLAEDNQLNHVKGKGAGNGKAVFTIPLQYQLDGNQLVATVPVKEIKGSEGFHITELDLLNYFGAGSEKDKGYMLVPDGSGGLIDFNNGKTYSDAYSQTVYDDDQTMLSPQASTPSNKARLPIFGIKSGDQATIGIISQGDSIASINADVSGRTNSYNYAYAGFQLNYHQQIVLNGAGTTATDEILQPKIYSGNIQVRYGFLSGDQANYGGMAAYYRNYLQQQYKLNAIKPNQHIPFYLDLVGSISKRATILGVPYSKMIPLTSFQNAEQLVTELQNDGISNIQLRYLGAFNHGMSSTVANHVSIDSDLGGKSGFESMIQFMQKHNVNVYPDVSFTKVFQNSPGFKPSKEASRKITKEIADFNSYNVADGYAGDGANVLHYYLLSPNSLPSVVSGFLNSYKSYGLNTISLRYFGDVLNSDYNVKNPIDRGQSEATYENELSKIQKVSPNIMVTGGNAYTLPYAKQIVNMPLSDSHFLLEDQSVPFYQMVVHGLINYAGDPINLDANQDVKYQMLKCLEYGAFPHFEWYYQPNTEVLDTPYEKIYSGNYKNWVSDAKQLYSQMDKVYAKIQNQQMVSHTKLQDNVYKTTYSNGTFVIVNYNTHAVNVDGQSVGPKNFAVGGGI